LNCASVRFSRHAFERMFERGLSPATIEQAIITGEPIADYRDDRPLPSALLLAFDGQRPIHLVVAQDPATQDCVVITVYLPDPILWSDDYKTRRTK
jgi:hypothetical protein